MKANVNIQFYDGLISNCMSMDDTYNMVERSFDSTGIVLQLTLNEDTENVPPIESESNPQDSNTLLPTSAKLNAVVFCLKPKPYMYFKKIVQIDQDDKSNRRGVCHLDIYYYPTPGVNTPSLLTLELTAAVNRNQIPTYLYIGFGSYISQMNGRNFAFDVIPNIHHRRLFLNFNKENVLEEVHPTRLRNEASGYTAPSTSGQPHPSASHAYPSPPRRSLPNPQSPYGRKRTSQRFSSRSPAESEDQETGAVGGLLRSDVFVGVQAAETFLSAEVPVVGIGAVGPHPGGASGEMNQTYGAVNSDLVVSSEIPDNIFDTEMSIAGIAAGPHPGASSGVLENYGSVNPDLVISAAVPDNIFETIGAVGPHPGPASLELDGNYGAVNPDLVVSEDVPEQIFDDRVPDSTDDTEDVTEKFKKL